MSYIISKSHDCPYCGPGHQNECYVVYSDGFYCYSCGRGVKKDESNYAYRSATNTIGKSYTNVLPMANTEFPVDILKWLYKYRVYDKHIKKYGLCHVPGNDTCEKSLVLPITGESYQQRYFPTKRFYNTPDLKSNVFIAKPEINKYVGCVVLVEDYISAIRVGEIVDTLCLFGTGLTNTYKDHIIKNYDTTLVWLDNDEPGIDASKKIKSSLLYYNQIYTKKYIYKVKKCKKVLEIHSDLQPKEYTDAKIDEIIQENLNYD